MELDKLLQSTKAKLTSLAKQAVTSTDVSPFINFNSPLDLVSRNIRQAFTQKTNPDAFARSIFGDQKPLNVLQSATENASRKLRNFGEDIIEAGTPNWQDGLHAEDYARSLFTFPAWLGGGFLQGIGRAGELASRPKKSYETFRDAPLFTFKSLSDYENPSKASLALDIALPGLDISDVSRYGLMGLVAGGTKANFADNFDVPALIKRAESSRTLEAFKSGLERLEEVESAVKRVGFESLDDFWKQNNSAFKRLRSLLDESYAQTSYRRFDSQQIGEAAVNSVIAEDELPRFTSALNRIFDPLKNTPLDVQRAVNTWQATITEGRVLANNLAQRYVHIPESEGFKMIRYIERPTPKQAKILSFDPDAFNKEIKEIRQTYDNLRQEGRDKGLNIKYLQNYMNHVWVDSWSTIERKARGLSETPAFVKERRIPTYEEGIAIGLTPRFTHPAQLVAHYKNSLDKAVANKVLADNLVNSGVLIPSSKAPDFWKAIDAPLFPKAEHKVGNKVVVEQYKASPAVALAINNIFAEEVSGFAHLAAGVSRLMQDLTLSGGFKTLNAFSLGNLIKEITAGRIISPLLAFTKSFSEKTSNKFFEQNSEYILYMAQEGLDVRNSRDYTKLFRNLTEDKTLKSMLGETWNNYINKPTFERFLPMLEVNLFKDVYTSTVDSLGHEGARRLSAETLRNFYGKSNTIARSQFTEDVLTSVTFAPKFRESMINFWKRNLEAIDPRKYKDRSLDLNRRFIVGTGLTYFLYSYLNAKLNGHPMHENKAGKEFFLEIPRPDGRSWFIPMLPSVGTVPRRALEIGSNLFKGDIAEATKLVGGFASQPLSLGTQLATNRTFYGGPIYDREDNPVQKLSKLAGYGVEQSSHPFLGEPISVAQGRKTPVEGLLGLLEMPVYPSKSTPGRKVATNLPSKIEEKISTLEAMDTSDVYKSALQQNEAFKLVDDILEDTELTSEQKGVALERMGLDRNTAEYYQVASQEVNLRSAFLESYLSKNPDASLVPFRAYVNGKRVLTSSVIDELVKKGLVSPRAASILKKTEVGKDGSISSASGSSRKPKTLKLKVSDLSISARKASTGSARSIKLKEPKKRSSSSKPKIIDVQRLRRELGLS